MAVCGVDDIKITPDERTRGGRYGCRDCPAAVCVRMIVSTCEGGGELGEEREERERGESEREGELHPF